MATLTTYTVWACQDCLMAAAGYTEHETGTVPELEPWTRLGEGETVSPGFGWEDHTEDCPNRVAGGTVDCDCETQDFSTSPCGGCGSHLAGSRHAVTVFSREG